MKMMLLKPTVALLGAALSLGVLGAPPAYEAAFVPVAPALDGDLSDACWQSVLWSSPFVSREGAAPQRASRYKAVSAADAVYVAVECEEVTPGNMADEHQAHEFWLCDVVEIFSCAAKNEMLHLVCSARGNLNDEIPGKTAARTKGNVGWQAKSKIGKDRWTCEFRIPFLLFGAVPADGALNVPFNVCRNATTVKELSSWSHATNFKSQANYGTLKLAQAPADRAAALRKLVDTSLIPESAEARVKREDTRRIMKRLFDE